MVPQYIVQSTVWYVVSCTVAADAMVPQYIVQSTVWYVVSCTVAADPMVPQYIVQYTVWHVVSCIVAAVQSSLFAGGSAHATLRSSSRRTSVQRCTPGCRQNGVPGTCPKARTATRSLGFFLGANPQNSAFCTSSAPQPSVSY